jgi:hypothetical protein
MPWSIRASSTHRRVGNTRHRPDPSAPGQSATPSGDRTTGTLALTARRRASVFVRRCLRPDDVEGSHGDRAVVDRAFAGADAVFWLTPPSPQAPSVEAAYVDFTRPAADAFKRHSVTRVVGVPALGRGTAWAGRAGYVTASLAMDDLIASRGVSYRALTNPSFMDNIVRQAESIKKQGVFFSPIAGIASCHPSPPATSLEQPHVWYSTRAGPASTRFRCSAPKICPSTTWREIISDVLGTQVRFRRSGATSNRVAFTPSRRYSLCLVQISPREVIGAGRDFPRSAVGASRPLLRCPVAAAPRSGRAPASW